MTNSKVGTLIVIAGPTGSGKTDLSIDIAQRFDAPIISTDSRQVFRGMAIGTAQPDIEQLAAVKHFFIADREYTEEYNSGKFEQEALQLLDELFLTNNYVVAVGGSGLYIDALCNGLDALPLADNELRQSLSARLDSFGLSNLLEELQQRDPEYYDIVDRANPARVMRALEVCISTDAPYSAQRTRIKAERSFNIIKIGVKTDRAELYDRINRRVDMMIADGLEAEARKLYPMRHINALQTIGYKEFFDYFEGKLTYDEAIELIKRNSRRYAKRQITWFNKDADIEWFEKKETKKIEIFIKKFAGR